MDRFPTNPDCGSEVEIAFLQLADVPERRGRPHVMTPAPVKIHFHMPQGANPPGKPYSRVGGRLPVRGERISEPGNGGRPRDGALPRAGTPPDSWVSRFHSVSGLCEQNCAAGGPGWWQVSEVFHLSEGKVVSLVAKRHRSC